MQENNFKIIREIKSSKCYKCDGQGMILNNTKQYIWCNVCDGTGQYKENYYYHIINNIAFDGDTIK